MKNTKGFSLVEVIVSIAILSVLAISFVPLFGGSFENIFTFGQRDQTTSYISDAFESLYAEQPYSSENDIEDILVVYESEWDHDFDFSVEAKIPGSDFDNEGYKVTIEAFYRDGERSVELSSFIRGED